MAADEQRSYTRVVEDFELRFDEFVERYENDMRGDKSLGNGQPGMIGAIRKIQTDQENMWEAINKNHNAIFGDEENPKKQPGLLREFAQACEQLGSYKRFVWIVIGAFTAGGIGLLINAIL